MANREENLKKINAELEKLDDNELDKVAGGFWKNFSVYDPSLQKPNQNLPEPAQYPHKRKWD